MALSREEKAAKTERLFNEYAASLLRMCTLYLRDRAEAEDAVQEVFIKAYHGLDRFRGESEIKTWLMRIAINQCKSMLRKKSGRETCMDYDDSSSYSMKESVGDDTVSRKVMELPPKYREVILLYYYQELTIREIAIVTGESVSNVSVRLSRGRRRLSNALKEWNYD